MTTFAYSSTFYLFYGAVVTGTGGQIINEDICFHRSTFYLFYGAAVTGTGGKAPPIITA